jgi:hypothetical protein
MATQMYSIGDHVHWSRSNGNEGDGVILDVQIYRNLDGSKDIIYTVDDPDPDCQPELVNQTQIDGIV